MAYVSVNVSAMQDYVSHLRQAVEDITADGKELLDVAEHYRFDGDLSSWGQLRGPDGWLIYELNELYLQADQVVQKVLAMEADCTTPFGDIFYFPEETPNLPNPDWTPTQVAAWWAGLSDKEKQAAINGYPSKIGNLDGIDLKSRAQANQLRLVTFKADSEKAVTDAQAALDAAQAALDAALADFAAATSDLDRETLAGAIQGATQKVNAAREALEAAQKRQREIMALWYAANGYDPETGEKLSEDTLNDPNHQMGVVLLDVPDDLSQPVKGAVSVGQVDTAPNVVVLVSGMTSDVTSTKGYLDHIEALRKTATGIANPADYSQTAGIYWMGYDAPDGLNQARHTSWGREGAPALAAFLNGFQASRQSGSTDPNLTLIGHSYGGYVIGVAATLVDDGVIDNLIFTGTPGTGVNDISQFHVPLGHVFAVCAEPQFVPQPGASPQWDRAYQGTEVHDEIVGILFDGPAGKGPDELPGVVQLSGEVGPPRRVLQPGQPVLDPNEAPPGLSDEVAGLHMSYFDYEADGKTPTQALIDMADVIAGNR